MPKPFISVQEYARKYLPNAYNFQDDTGMESNRGKWGRYFPNAQNAYLKDHGYVRVQLPAIGDKLVYVEVEGPTIEVKLTKIFFPMTRDIALYYDVDIPVKETDMYYELSPIHNGKPFIVDQALNKVDYFLLKKGRTAARTQTNREQNLRNGPHTRHRLSGGKRRVTRRTTRVGS